MSAKFHDDPILREYGLKVHTEMEKVQGRVLEAPSIKYKEDIPVRNMYLLYSYVVHTYIHICTCTCTCALVVNT